MMHDCQGSDSSATKPLSVVDAMDRWVDDSPAKIAFRFLREDGSYDVISYIELHRWARAIGIALRRDYEPGTRAILLFPHGLDFIAAFLGCLYSGVVAVPVCSPRLNRPSSPLTALIQSCQPRLVLSGADYTRRRGQVFSQIPELLSLPWIQADGYRHGSSAGAGNGNGADIDESALALLQYTSGSTGHPKGVMVTRANLACNSHLIRQAFKSSPKTRGVFWLPHYHDMGLIGSILGTIYCGGGSVLMSPLTLIRRPITWLEAITQTHATITGGPDFGYALCADKISPSQRERLDLSSLEVVFSGAEPVRYETLEKFSKAFASCGFRREMFMPCYGLAEATLMVSSRLVSTSLGWLDVDAAALERNQVSEPVGDTNRRIVSCGNPMPGQEIKIVDSASQQQCRDGHVGEIWVHGPSVAQGYWNNPEATRETFHSSSAVADAEPITYLRTGDLGFLHAGELYVTGRLKDVIIVRGRNLYPHDIEWTARHSCEQLNDATAAAFSLDVDGREELVIVLELERRARDGEYAPLIQAVCRAIGSEHEISVHAVVLVRAGMIPRTSSGKLRRSACRQDYLTGALEVLHAWVGDGDDSVFAGSDTPPTAVESVTPNAPDEAQILRWLTAKIASVTSLPEGAIKPSAPFASFGLSSLQGVMLVEQLQKFVGREIPATWIYNYPSIQELAHRLVDPQNVVLTADQPALRDDEMRREIDVLSIAELEALVAGKMSKQSTEQSTEQS